MSVYVDAPIEYTREPSGYIGRRREHARWCHMIADTLDELHAMASRLGLRRAWFQISHRGTPHYDLVPSKRALAVKLGAIALDRRDFVEKARTVRT